MTQARTGRLNRQLVGPFTGRHLLALGGTVAAVALVAALATSPIAGPAATPLPTPGSSFFVIAPATVGLQPGDVAPELTGTVDGQTVRLTDLEGQPITLAALRGKPVWINFWATWCPPCQEETPVLRDVYETHREQGLEVVAISVQETTVDDVRRYADTYDLAYTIGFDGTSAIFKTYRAFGLPTQLFIDRDGVIRNVVRGPLTELQAEQILAPILDE